MTHNLAVLLLCLAALACGRAPTEVRTEPTVLGSCRAVKEVPFTERGVTVIAVLVAHYTVCPSDTALAASGWKRVP